MKRLLMLVGILVAAACGGGGKPGPGGGGGGDLTLGEVCDQVGETVCDKIADCGAPVDDCESTFKDACCSGSDCDAEVNASESDVEECTDDIRGLDCSEENLPSSCTSL